LKRLPQKLIQVPAVFLLASEVWEPLASGHVGYKSEDSVVYITIFSTDQDSATRRESLRCFPVGQMARSRPFVTITACLADMRSRFQITPDNFFVLARLADKFIIPHLVATLQYYSHSLIATTKPCYELWLTAARHEMPLIEKTCRNIARGEVGRVLAEKGISYYIIDQRISPTAMDGVIMDLMRVKDNFISHRQARGGIAP
jgi:hypothetical protein